VRAEVRDAEARFGIGGFGGVLYLGYHNLFMQEVQ